MILASLSAISRVYFAFAFENAVALDVLTIFRCEGLLLGAAFATALRVGQNAISIRLWAFRSLPLLLIIAVAIVISDRRSLTIAHTIVAMICASGLAVLVTSNHGSLLVQWFELPFLRTLGKYSYAIYIFQSPLIPLMSGIFSIEILTSLVGGKLAATILYMTVMSATTFVLALISWHVLETHCLKWRPFQTSHETNS